MSKATKVFIIIAVIFIAAGAVLSTVGYLKGGIKPLFWDGSSVRVLDVSDTSEVVTVEKNFNENAADITAIKIEADWLAQIKIKKGEVLSVNACNPKAFGGVSTKVENRVLTVNSKQYGETLLSFGIPFLPDFTHTMANSYIEITVPETMKLKNVRISGDYPNILVSDIKADEISVYANMGNIEITGSEAETLGSWAEMGKMTMSSCNIGEFTAGLGAGVMNADDVKARSAEINVDAGSADFYNFNCDDLILRCNMGGVDLNGILKGNADVSCDMGSIKLNLNQPSDKVSLKADVDMGSIKVNGKAAKSGSYNVPNPMAVIKASTDMGSIDITFNK